MLDRLDGTCGGDKNMKITFVAKSMKAQGKKIIMNATFHILEDILGETAVRICTVSFLMFDDDKVRLILDKNFDNQM